MSEEKIDVKIVSEEEAMWTKIVDARKASIKHCQDTIAVETVFLSCAEQKLAEIRAKSQ